MLFKIALRRLQCWINQPGEKDLFQSKVLGFEVGQLGFRFTNLDEFTSTNGTEFRQAIEVLKEMRGDDVKYVPLFTRFPDDLPNDTEYLIRRILGFFGLNTFSDNTRFGADPISQRQQEDLWQTAVAAQAGKFDDTHTEWINLTLVSEEAAHKQLKQWVTNLLYGVTPVKEALWEDIFIVLDLLKIQVDVEQVRIKETLARLAAAPWQKWHQVLVKTPTDFLRMLAFIQGQNVSLAQPVNLKGLKLSKPQRRAAIAFLDTCPALGEDLLRYRKLWISLSRWLHPGDFIKQYPRVVQAFDDLRNDRLKSFDSLVINAPPEERLHKLLERPSVFLRKITWLLKEYSPEVIAQTILSLQDQVATLPLPLLLTTYCAIKYRGDRVAINKNGKSHTVKSRADLGNLSPVLYALDTLILTKLRGSKSWKTVWIDPVLYNLVLPLQVRKQSAGLLNLARGSRLALETPVVRLFVYWQEQKMTTDLDLSAMHLNSNFQYLDHIGWNNYSSGQDIAHSGDIQSAPLGAAEFIDITLTSLTDGYVLPSILRFRGEEFTDLRACYAGWMNRQAVGADTQTFDAKTVAEKVDINQDGKIWIPFLLDIAAKEIIYVDIYLKGQRIIESNSHFPALAAAIATYWQAKPTFGILADWYIRANNANLVERENAEIMIGTTDNCTINVLKLVGEGVTSF